MACIYCAFCAPQKLPVGGEGDSVLNIERIGYTVVFGYSPEMDVVRNYPYWYCVDLYLREE